MKNFWRHFFAFVFIFSLLYPTVAATNTMIEDSSHSVKLFGNYLSSQVSLGTGGFTIPNSKQVILSRFQGFAKTYECDIYLGLWETLENSEYDSFDAMEKDLFQYATEAALCIVYVNDLNKANIHIGTKLSLQADKNSLIDKLTKSNQEDPFDKIASFFDMLCKMLGDERQKYVIGGYLSSKSVNADAIEKALIPLHEIFPGYICVDYYTGMYKPEDENSILRRSQENGFDDVYTQPEHTLEYYFKDTIYITYYSQSGTAFLDFGESTGINFPDNIIKKMENSFLPSDGENSCSGFENGVTILVDTLLSTSANKARTIQILIFGCAGLNIFLFVLTYRKKSKRQIEAK